MACSKCGKKPKEVKKLDELIVDVDVPVYSEIDIQFAYHELTNMKGVNPEYKDFISNVYEYIFKEKFDWECGSCVSTQVRKFHNYMINELKIKV